MHHKVSSLRHMWNTVRQEKVRTCHDPLFSLLHLWTHRRHPEFSVSSGSHKKDLIPVPTASRLHVFGMYRHWRLHCLFLAHLSSSQL